MSAFEIIAIVCAICGAVMIVGGIISILKGIIRLPTSSADGILTVEFKDTLKDIRVTTRNAALAFFIIGLFFFVIPLWFTRPTGPSPVRFTGKLVDVQGCAQLVVDTDSWILKSDSFGDIRGTITPRIDNFWINVSAPGYDPVNKTIGNDQIVKGNIDLGNIALKQIVENKNIATNIVKLPANYTPPPLSEKGSFGGVK